MNTGLTATVLRLVAVAASAAPTAYAIDLTHNFAGFEADHIGGAEHTLAEASPDKFARVSAIRPAVLVSGLPLATLF